MIEKREGARPLALRDWPRFAGRGGNDQRVSDTHHIEWRPTSQRFEPTRGAVASECVVPSGKSHRLQSTGVHAT